MRNVEVILDKISNLMENNNFIEVERFYTKLQMADVPKEELDIINDSVKMVYNHLAKLN